MEQNKFQRQLGLHICVCSRLSGRKAAITSLGNSTSQDKADHIKGEHTRLNQTTFVWTEAA